MFRTLEFLAFKKSAFPLRPVYHLVNILLPGKDIENKAQGGVEKWEPVLVAFSLLFPLSSLASVVEGMSVFISARVISIVLSQIVGCVSLHSGAR